MFYHPEKLQQQQNNKGWRKLKHCFPPEIPQSCHAGRWYCSFSKAVVVWWIPCELIGPHFNIKTVFPVVGIPVIMVETDTSWQKAINITTLKSNPFFGQIGVLIWSGFINVSSQYQGYVSQSCTKITVTTQSKTHFDGILPKGPYPPCLRMADRALLAGYPRNFESYFMGVPNFLAK